MSVDNWLVPPPALPPTPSLFECAVWPFRWEFARPPLVVVYPSTVARAAAIAQAGVGAQS